MSGYSSDLKRKVNEVDLIFGSILVLHAIAQVYASDGAKQQFADDFITARVKVINLDRFDLS